GSARTGLAAERQQSEKDKSEVQKTELKSVARRERFEATRVTLPKSLGVASEAQCDAIVQAVARAEALRDAAKTHEDREREASRKIRDEEALLKAIDLEQVPKLAGPRQEQQQRASVFTVALSEAASLAKIELQAI